MQEVIDRLRAAKKNKKGVRLTPLDASHLSEALEDLIDAGIICRALESGNDFDMDAVSRIGEVTEDLT